MNDTQLHDREFITAEIRRRGIKLTPGAQTSDRPLFLLEGVIFEAWATTDDALGILPDLVWSFNIHQFSVYNKMPRGCRGREVFSSVLRRIPTALREKYNLQFEEE